MDAGEAVSSWKSCGLQQLASQGNGVAGGPASCPSGGTRKLHRLYENIAVADVQLPRCCRTVRRSGLTNCLDRGKVTYIEVLSKYSEAIAEERVKLLTPAFLVVSEGHDRLRLIGELDIEGVPGLRALLAGMDGDIEVDCSGLTFIDCAGLRVLEVAQRAREVAGTRMFLAAPPRCLTRWLALAGLEGFFHVRDGLGS